MRQWEETYLSKRRRTLNPLSFPRRYASTGSRSRRLPPAACRSLLRQAFRVRPIRPVQRVVRGAPPLGRSAVASWLLGTLQSGRASTDLGLHWPGRGSPRW